MKNNQFEKAANIYEQILHKEGTSNIEVLYLLGVCKYHLERFEEAIKIFINVLVKDDHYRKNVYLFLAISYKKINEIEDSLLIVILNLILACKSNRVLSKIL